MHILIVDDDDDLVFLLSSMFKTLAGTSTTVCRDVTEAMDCFYGDFTLDMALIDFRAPGKHTSIELCRFIREQSSHCLLFLMSGMAREFMESAATDEADIEDFLEKPFNIPKLLTRVKRMIDTPTLTVAAAKKPSSLALTEFPPSSSAQIDTYRELLEQSPDDLSVRQLLAFCLYTAGRYAEALKEYDRVAAGGVSTFLTEYYSGHTCARLFRYRAAITRWERALTMAPSNEVVARVKERIAAAHDLERMQQKVLESGPFKRLDI